MRDACASSRVGSSEVAFLSASMARAYSSRLFVEPCELDEEREVQLPKFIAPALSPFLVAILGKKLARVQVDRRPVGRRLPGASGGCRSVLEGIHVHPQLPLRAQDELLVPETQVALTRTRGGIEYLASAVDDLAQVVGGRPRGRVGPEQVHRLLSVHSMAGSQGEELHEARRLLRAPGILRDGRRTYTNPKASEQPYPYDLAFPTRLRTAHAPSSQKNPSSSFPAS